MRTKQGFVAGWRRSAYDSVTGQSNVQTQIVVKVRRERRESGEIVSFTALAPSGRILRVAEILIPLIPGFPLSERIGEEQEKEIFAIAEDLSRRIAVGVLTEPLSH